MATYKTITEPFEITIKPDNWFHFGWIDYILGEKLRKFDYVDKQVSAVNQDAYREGYQTAKETFDSNYSVAWCIARMRILKQLEIKANDNIQ